MATLQERNGEVPGLFGLVKNSALKNPVNYNYFFKCQNIQIYQHVVDLAAGPTNELND